MSDGRQRIALRRLELVAATELLARLALVESADFAQLLKAEIPADWPPIVVSDTRPFVARTLAADPASAGWWLWYVVLRRPHRVLIGEAGFKGPPGADGTVEAGYALIERWRGHRYAGEALCGLCDWAFRDARVRRVIGRTYPHLLASIRTMERNKFRRVGPPDSDGIITLARQRSSDP